MHFAISRPLAIALTMAGLLAAPSAQAGPGGDEGHAHGADPAAAAGPTQPRFVAATELFELVGIVDGRQLRLYLDHSADNSPVVGAKLELKLGGTKIDVKPRADGEFEATLARPLEAGTIPVTATVLAGAQTDLLAAEINVRPQAAAEAPHGRSWKALAAWTAAGLAALSALAWLGRRAFGARSPRSGAAA